MSPDEKLRKSLYDMSVVTVEGFSPEAPLSLSPPGGPAIEAWILDELACSARSPVVFQNLWDRAPVAVLYRTNRPAGTAPEAPCFRWPEEHKALEKWLSDGRLSARKEQELPGGSVVAVAGPRGGVGKTLVSTSLAARVSAAGERSLVMDLDLYLPGAHTQLNLSPEVGLVSLLPYLDDLSVDVWERHLVRHEQSGLWLLAGPPQPEMAELVEPSHLGRLVGFCRSRYRAVVLDLPSGLTSDLIWEALGLADSLLVVVRPDPSSILAARAFIDLTSRLGADHLSPRLVINGMHQGSALQRDECERHLGLRSQAVLELDTRAAVEAQLKGRPVTIASEPGSLGSSLNELAAILWPGVAPSPVRRPAQPLESLVGWWGRWRR